MDVELPCEEQRKREEIGAHKECGECNRCQVECPTKSIHPVRVNPNVCLSYLTQKKELSDSQMALLKGNVFGCDFCQLECPYNLKAEKSPLKEFQTLDYMEDEIDVYAAMDNKFFKEKISGTSCGWRGKNVIRRNALIHMAGKGKSIEEYRGDSPYINEYIERLQEKNER